MMNSNNNVLRIDNGVDTTEYNNNPQNLLTSNTEESIGNIVSSNTKNKKNIYFLIFYIIFYTS
jgi:hypothetical protein